MHESRWTWYTNNYQSFSYIILGVSAHGCLNVACNFNLQTLCTYNYPGYKFETFTCMEAVTLIPWNLVYGRSHGGGSGCFSGWDTIIMHGMSQILSQRSKDFCGYLIGVDTNWSLVPIIIALSKSILCNSMHITPSIMPIQRLLRTILFCHISKSIKLYL